MTQFMGFHILAMTLGKHTLLLTNMPYFIISCCGRNHGKFYQQALSIYRIWCPGG